MMRLSLLAAMLFATTFVSAQDFESKYKEKLAKDFVKAVPWVQDYDEALAQAKKTGKPIFGYFTRSYSP